MPNDTMIHETKLNPNIGGTKPLIMEKQYNRLAQCKGRLNSMPETPSYEIMDYIFGSLIKTTHK